MNDLLALATIRRLMLELGVSLRPEPEGQLVGPLELWMHEPRTDLDGDSPFRALATDGGVERVRESLRTMLVAAQTSANDDTRE